MTDPSKTQCLHLLLRVLGNKMCPKEELWLTRLPAGVHACGEVSMLTAGSQGLLPWPPFLVLEGRRRVGSWDFCPKCCRSGVNWEVSCIYLCLVRALVGLPLSGPKLGDLGWVALEVGMHFMPLVLLILQQHSPQWLNGFCCLSPLTSSTEAGLCLFCLLPSACLH